MESFDPRGAEGRPLQEWLLSEPIQGPKVPHVQILGCGAPPVAHIGKLVRMIQSKGWTCNVVLTPDAVDMLMRSPDDLTEINHLEQLTGYPVRRNYRKNWEEKADIPRPDAFLVAPATVNTVNKAVLGIGDTLVAGILVEKIGAIACGVDVPPIFVMPFTNQKHAAHPMFQFSLQKLEQWGVNVIYGGRFGYELPIGHTTGAVAETFPWHVAMRELEKKLSPDFSIEESSVSSLGRSLGSDPKVLALA